MPPTVTSRLQIDRVLLAIVFAAVAVRIYLAATMPYLHDEAALAIPLAESISFSPGTVHLPIRGDHHPALPSYVIWASKSVFGANPLGYRLLHVVAGLGSLLLAYRLARELHGKVAAQWTAILLACNEYHLGVSAYATAKGPHLFFMMVALYSFSRFLTTGRQGGLYASAGALGLAFYAKEHAALVIAVMGLTLCLAAQRHWLRRPAPYLAVALFALIVTPDVLWNLGSPRPGQATYFEHLERIGGLGFTPHHLMFFLRDASQSASVFVTGSLSMDGVPENPAMNSLIGALMLGAALVPLIRFRSLPAASQFLLLVFWGILGFFLMIRPGVSSIVMDPVTWYWIDVTMFPAAIMLGSVLSQSASSSRAVWWTLAIVGCALGVWKATAGGFTFP